tara:strand:+ start:16492 stop:16800 length:309 start_codon:yes stop_codon:yes gene_type:complete
VKECEEAVQEEVVRDGCRRVVLPDASALDHVALLHLGFGRGSLFFTLGLVATSGCKFSLEVVLDLLLRRLLLFLKRSEVVLSGFLVAFLLLLGRLLLLLSIC